MVDLPHVAKHALGDQMGPEMQKAMQFGSPPHQGLRNCGLSQKYFLGPAGVIFAVRALLAVFRSWFTTGRIGSRQQLAGGVS